MFQPLIVVPVVVSLLWLFCRHLHIMLMAERTGFEPVVYRADLDPSFFPEVVMVPLVDGVASTSSCPLFTSSWTSFHLCDGLFVSEVNVACGITATVIQNIFKAQLEIVCVLLCHVLTFSLQLKPHIYASPIRVRSFGRQIVYLLMLNQSTLPVTVFLCPPPPGFTLLMYITQSCSLWWFPHCQYCYAKP